MEDVEVVERKKSKCKQWRAEKKAAGESTTPVAR
jgi:hypothetical protein